ncbi:adenylate/guanylate cyclase domain-containing protein [Elioraea rosea]|uniref:adenylate/guanylate cyclase domain-containing protein n=1 Tax=Elioraea rosea TaxID=2492390 RepID=UPI0011824532|nr:adenylate/guanylate cyclase domain-containing protein [Elioraea rosea]
MAHDGAMTLSCRDCGEVLPPAARFCPACGTRVAQAAPGPVADGGERRHVTVLFCDLVGSTGLAARMDPEEFADLLVAYRQEAIGCARRHGGHITRYVGDGILMTFGYPRALGRDAEAAIACGLELVGAITARYPDGVAGRPVTVRIGIESGLVLIGNIGPEGGVEQDAIVGDVPNTAAKLQVAAPPGGVVIGEGTQRVAGQHFLCRDIGAPPGLARPMRVQLVTGRAHSARVRLGFDGAPPPLIGREAELEALATRWRKAADGYGQVVFLSGEAGIGKSRLALALSERIAQASAAHADLVATCAPQTESSALRPLVVALRRALGLGDAAPASDIAAAADQLIDMLRLPREPARSILAALLEGGDLPSAATLDMTPEAIRRVVFDALLAFVAQKAEQAPLMFLVEDLHWADPSLLAFVRLLVEQIVRQRVLLVATHRPEMVPDVPEHGHVLRLALRPLAASESRRIVAAGVGAGLDEATVGRIVARCDGVPLFLEEYARAATERGGAEEAEVPETLAEVLESRLDAVGEAKATAQVAAVLGREVTADLLRPLCGLGPEALLSHLDRLAAAGLLVPTRAVPEPAYAFRHAVLREAAYASLRRDKRRALHRATAELIASAHPELARAEPETVALHWAEAGEAQRAAALWRVAAARALGASANEEAERHVRAALRVLPPGEQAGEETRLLTLQLMLQLGSALTALRGYAAPETFDAFESARRLAEGLTDAASLYPVLSGLKAFYMVRGPLPEARRLGERLLALAERGGNPAHLRDARRRMGWCLTAMGELADGEAMLRQVVAEEGPVPEGAGSDVVAMAWGNLAMNAMLAGPAETARAAAEAGVRRARRGSHSLSLAYAAGLAATSAQVLGDVEATRSLAEEVHAVALDRGITYWSAMARIISGWVRAVDGEPADGVARIRAGIALYLDTQGAVLLPYAQGLLADALALAGQEEAAREAVRHGIATATTLGGKAFLPDLLRRLGTLGEADAFDRAAALAEVMGAHLALERIVRARAHAVAADAAGGATAGDTRASSLSAGGIA